MLAISPPQLTAFQADYRARRGARLCAELYKLSIFPIQFSQDHVCTLVREAMEDGEDLGITSDDDLFRFAALGLFTVFAGIDDAKLSAILRVLNRTAWPAQKRLDFIYERVLCLNLPKFSA